MSLWPLVVVATVATSNQVLVVTGEMPVVERALLVELGAAGFVPVLIESSDARGFTSLRAVARSGNALAALRLVASDAEVEVWVYDRSTGKASIRSLPAGANNADGARLTAVRAVELLRISLRELEVAAPAEAEVAPPTTMVTETPTTTTDLLRVIAGFEAGTIVAPGLSPGAAAGLRVEVRSNDRVGLRGGATLLVPALALSGNAGGVDVGFSSWSAALTAGAYWRPVDDVEFLVGASARGEVITLQGRVDPPRAGVSALRPTASLALELGAEWWLTDRLSLALHLDGSAASPTLDALSEDNVVATYGPVIGRGLLGVRVVVN